MRARAYREPPKLETIFKLARSVANRLTSESPRADARR